MPTLPVTWYAIVALLITNLITGVMWQAANRDMKIIQMQSELASQESKRVIEEQKRITEDTTNAWKAALDTSRADWAKRLRLANVQPMPGISGPTGGVDGLPTDSLALAAQCAETTKQLITLQRWVRQQEKVK